MDAVWQVGLAAVRAVFAPLPGGLGGGSAAGAGVREAAAVAASAREVRENLPLALVLSLLAGGSTGLGGLLMVTQADHSPRRLGLWQGAAAGFMISVSLFDMLPTVLESLSPAVAAFYLALGAGLFLALRRLIPEPDLDDFFRIPDALTPGPAAVMAKANLNSGSTRSSNGGRGDKGVAVVPFGIDATSEGGSALDKETRYTIPVQNQRASRAVLWSGLVTAIGISLHNFPEGIAVCVASVRGLQFGLPLAAAIAVHNLPEGAAVALPVYFATGDKAYAVRLAFLSGMAEPLGVLCMAAVVYATDVVLTKDVLAVMLAIVAGVMLVICAIELIPQASAHAGTRIAVLSTSAGLLVMLATLAFIDWTGVGAP
jgi:zinc transporter, ZIP family